MRCPPAFGAAALSLALVGAAPAIAQSVGIRNDDPFDVSSLPALDASPELDRPRFELVLLNEYPLPGPLPDQTPRRVGERLELGVRGGLARLDPLADGTPEIVADAAPDSGAASGGGTGPEPHRRYSSSDGRSVVAERRCRSGRSWCRDWRLKIAGVSPATPIAVDDRVCFGAADNRIYCVHASNGHRVFAVDVGARAMRPLTAISAQRPEDPSPIALILAILEPGTRLVGIDLREGREVSRVDLSDSQGYFIGQPLAWDNQTILTARQNYERASAALVVWRLVAKGPHPRGDATPVSPAPKPTPDPP